MARNYSPRNNKRLKKSKRRGRRGIGAADDSKTYDLCMPAWAAILIGGLGAYGLLKATK